MHYSMEQRLLVAHVMLFKNLQCHSRLQLYSFDSHLFQKARAVSFVLHTLGIEKLLLLGQHGEVYSEEYIVDQFMKYKY